MFLPKPFRHQTYTPPNPPAGVCVEVVQSDRGAASHQRALSPGRFHPSPTSARFRLNPKLLYHACISHQRVLSPASSISTQPQQVFSSTRSWYINVSYTSFGTFDIYLLVLERSSGTHHPQSAPHAVLIDPGSESRSCAECRVVATRAHERVDASVLVDRMTVIIMC